VALARPDGPERGLSSRQVPRPGSWARLEFGRVRDAFFFLSIAGLGVSVTGFSGLVTAFRRRGEGWTRSRALARARDSPAQLRSRIPGAPAIPLYALTGDEARVIRLVSGLVVIAYLSEIVAPRFDMANWPRRSWVASAAADSAFALVSLVSIFRGSDGTPGTCAVVAASSPSESLSCWSCAISRRRSPTRKRCPSGAEFPWQSGSSENADPNLALPMRDFYCGERPFSTSQAK